MIDWHWLQRWYYRYQSVAPLMDSFLKGPGVNPGTLFNHTEFLVVDLETTSLNPTEGEIVSIGWVPIVKGKILLSHAEHYFLTIHQGVGQSAVFHQVGDEQLANANNPGDVLKHFLSVAANKVLVFHYANLDMGFLNQACRQFFKVPLIARQVDTMVLEKRKLLRASDDIAPGQLRLFACRERYALPDYPAHDALTDALATAELLLAQVAVMSGKEADRKVTLKALL